MDLNLTNSQTPIVVSVDQVAENNRNYTVIENATFTDPTPEEGKGFKVFVRNGTAIIGGDSFTEGSFIFRIYYDGAFLNVQIDQTLAQTLERGNETFSNDIILTELDRIVVGANRAGLSKGTFDTSRGGDKGVSLHCIVGYELNFQAGFLRMYLVEGDGTPLPINSDSEIIYTELVTTTPTTGTSLITKDYADTKEPALGFTPENVANKKIDLTDNSDTFYPTQKAVKTALDLKVDAVAGKGLSENDFTNTLKTKLDGIEDGAQVNVNADWNATSGDAEILNKPTIPSAQVNSDWNATSGVAEILNKPTIPSAVTNTSDLINDGEDGVNPFITALDIPTAGQAGTLVREVKNMTGATLTKGTVVFISGANGNKPIVSKALAVSDALSSRTFGLLQSNILNNGVGYCVIIGDLSGLDTSAFTEGAQLYLSGTVAGTYTETKTLAPTHLVYVGKVTRSHATQGQIEVQIQNGYELNEIHDVAISSVANNQTLVYETATTLWKNKALTTAEVADSTDKRYVTDANLTVIGNTSGVNTGDQTLTGLGGVPTSRTVTINGTTQNLSTDISFTVGASLIIGTTLLTSGTEGRVLFQGASNVLQQDGAFFWDNTNKRLGVGGGSSTPQNNLQVYSNNATFALRVGQNTVNADGGWTGISFFNSSTVTGGNTATGQANIKAYRFSSGLAGELEFNLGSTSVMRIVKEGFVSIGAITAGAKLDVRAQGALVSDIAFRIRNSADTGDLAYINGIGDVALSSATITAGSGGNGTAIAIGAGAATNTAFTTYPIAIGRNSSSNGNSIAIGNGASTGTGQSTSSSLVIGLNSTSPSTYGNNIALGNSITHTNSGDNILIGDNLSFAGNGKNTSGIAIGRFFNSSPFASNGAYAIGSGVSAATPALLNITDSFSVYFRNTERSFFVNKNTNIVMRSVSVLTAGTHYETAATNTITIHNGTAPITNLTDAFQQYSADVVAGNAAPHFRTENGSVIKLYKETTAVTASTLVSNLGTPISDTDTFDGYTLKQIVKALRNQGLLA